MKEEKKKYTKGLEENRSESEPIYQAYLNYAAGLID